ncbi:MAG: ankyrin repeat domain-containing protein, partial [Spirochaetia bacterium]
MRKIILILLLMCVIIPAFSDMEQDFFEAVAAGDAEKVKQLIGEGIDVNATGESPTDIKRYIKVKDNMEINDRFAEHLAGPYPSVIGRWRISALLLAVYGNHSEIVTILLKAGADRKITNHGGRPLFMIAVEKGHAKIVEILVKAGADVNMKGENNKTPLMIAVGNGDTDIIDILLKAGAEDYIEQEWKDAALFSAMSNERTELFKQLIKEGADVNCRDSSGYPILLMAVLKGRPLTARLLIQNGA